MFGNIADAVRQIKSDVAHALDAALVVRLCRQLGHRWRERELDPVTTVQGFLLQVLHGNTACSHVPHLLGKKVSAEAYGAFVYHKRRETPWANRTGMQTSEERIMEFCAWGLTRFECSPGGQIFATDWTIRRARAISDSWSPEPRRHGGEVPHLYTRRNQRIIPNKDWEATGKSA